MNDSKFYQINPDVDGNHGPALSLVEFLHSTRKNYENSRTFFVEMMKYSLLSGADKLLMAKKSSARSNGLKLLSSSQQSDHIENGPEQNSETYSACEKKMKTKCCVRKKDRCEGNNIVSNEENVYGSKMVKSNAFPLNFLLFSTVLVLRLITLQISLLTSFFTIPLWLSYTALMLSFQTLMAMKKHLIITLSRIWLQLISNITSSIYTRLTGKKSLLNLAIKFSRALFWSIGVCFMLLGLLVWGFLVGSLVMRRLVEQPIKTTEALNFDYTKESPVALVPVKSSSTGAGFFSNLIFGAETMGNAGFRVIPYNHKLQLTVALNLPESDYNRELGVFQVRVEFLTSDGQVTASSSHPCMLRFKSHTIRLVETIFKTAPLIAGFQAESQVLKIKIHDLAEVYEPTASLKVTLEQRAEYNPGAGIPQIYAASLALESELPRIKKIVWLWRRTFFVWISMVAFWTELVIVLICFRPFIMPRGKVKDAGKKKISW